MNISTRVAEALDKMSVGDAEGALFQICSAIEGTAKREHGRGGGRNYKDFLHENMSLISFVAFGGRLKTRNLRLGYSHPKIKPAADGTCSLQQVIYHVVRCALYHGDNLPSNMTFTDEIAITGGDPLVLPKMLVYGLILAVVGSPANANESLPAKYEISLGCKCSRVDDFWGRKDDLMEFLQATDDSKD